MKHFLSVISALVIAGSSQAQLWDGAPLPPSWSGTSSIDSYFSDGGSLSEFDLDTSIEFSLQEYGTVMANIGAAHGWVDASHFATTVEAGDSIVVTFIGKTAGWFNDFGINLGGSNGSGTGAYTLWSSIDNGTPPIGDQYSITVPDDSPLMSLDFWLNSNAPGNGGTYSVFFPGSSVPFNTGMNHSAYGRLFDVFDDGAGASRSVLVFAIEDWREFDADFTDMFFAVEIYDREGDPQFATPEPSTYGLIGSLLLLGLAVFRRSRRA
jgi:hypothetical protein